MTTSFEQRLIVARDRFLAARDEFVAEVLAAARDASVEAVERAFARALATRSRLVSAPRNDVPPPALVTAPAVTPEPAAAPSAPSAPTSLSPSMTSGDGVELSASAPEASA
jgi:hypothetical protein